VSEVVQILLEFRFTRSVDLFKAVSIASIMHQRHGPEEFTSNLISGLVKVFEGHKTVWKRAQQERQKAHASIAESGGAANAANAAAIAAVTLTPAEVEAEEALNQRKRSTLRLLTELFLCGLTSDLKPLLGVLSELMSSDTRNEPDLSNTILHLLISWLKYGAWPILDLQSKKWKSALIEAELSTSSINLPTYLTIQQREQIMNKLFIPYGKQMYERLVGIHTTLQKLEKKAARMQMMRGEIPLDMQDQRRTNREQLSALQSQLDIYYDLLDSELEPLPIIQDAEDELFNLVTLESDDTSALEETELGAWDDIETKNFYENLIDLSVVVPPVLLQDGHDKEKAKLRREKDAAAAAETEEDGDDKSTSTSSAQNELNKKNKNIQDEDDSTYVPNWEMTIEQLYVDCIKLLSFSRYCGGTHSVGIRFFLTCLCVDVVCILFLSLFSEAKLASMGGPARSVNRRDNTTNMQNPDDPDSLYEEDEYGNLLIPELFIQKEKRSHPMETLISSMSHSLNREGVDSIAEKFCYLNTKNNRMRLVEAMYTLPRQRVDEIPYFCRLLATLNKHMKADMTEELVGLLTGEFYRLLRGKNQYRLESKIRNIRWLSELTKFQLTRPTLIFKIWHALLLSFTPNAIQLICLLLESCGRWLYRTPMHHIRCAQFLDRTMALKETKYLDKSLNLLLENAYFAVKPPPVQQSTHGAVKERTPIHLFIRKSLYQDLNAKNVDVIVKRLRKLNWNDAKPKGSTATTTTTNPVPTAAAAPTSGNAIGDAAETVPTAANSNAGVGTATDSTTAVVSAPPIIPTRTLAIKCLSNISNVSYASLTPLAHVTSVLNKFHQIGPVIVDNILENVRVGLEYNRYSQNQRRLTAIRYVGELYSFKLLDSQTLFDTFYLLLTFGHEVDEITGKLISKIDPPSDTFRVRLIVTLLETVGTILSSSSPILKVRLDRFLLYFQRYLFLKEILPIDLQFAVSDLFIKLRPHMKRPHNLEECIERIKEMDSHTHISHDRLISLTEADEENAAAATDANETEQGEEEEEEVDGDEEDTGKGDTSESYADKAVAGQSLLDAAIAAGAGDDNEDDAEDDDGTAEDGEDDEGEDDEDDEDDESSADEEEWERSAPSAQSNHPSRRAQEEDEFALELEKMMADAVEGAKQQPRIHQMATVEAITAGLDGPRSSPTSGAPALSTGSTVDGEEGVSFRFLSRHSKRSNNPQARSLFIPADSDMAASCVANAERALAEKADLKRLVLKGLERSNREQMEEERMNIREQLIRDKRDGVTHDFSHRNIHPSEQQQSAQEKEEKPEKQYNRPYQQHRGGGGGASKDSSNSLSRVGASLGAKTDGPSRDLSLKLESFAFASEETLTHSRVTLQGDSRRKK
jgi:hypothetical protein